MKFQRFSILFLLISGNLFAQLPADPLRLPDKKLNTITGKSDSVSSRISSSLDSLSIPGDSTAQAAMEKAATIRKSFQSRMDSIQLTYKDPVNEIDNERKQLQGRIDSLGSLRLPTVNLTAKRDSLEKLQSQKLGEMNAAVEKLKSKATSDLTGLKVPPQAQGQLDQLAKSIGGYKIPAVNGKIPDIDLVTSARLPALTIPNVNVSGANFQLPGSNTSNLNVPGVNVPNANGSVPGIKDIAAISTKTKQITDAAGQGGKYGSEIQNIKAGNVDTKQIEKQAETQLTKSGAAGELGAKTAELDQVKKMKDMKPDSMAMNNIKQEAMKQATNHFAGKEAVLQQAMGQMSKLKSRYSEVKSIAELPAKLPNPMSLLTFRERLIPGVTLQVQSRQSLLVDINPLALYRLTSRFSTGAGFNYRFAISDGYLNKKESIYGPRAVVQFKWMNALNLRLSPELMNVRVPIMTNNGLSTAEGHRDWVWSVFVGLKTDFHISKSVRGNTEALFNLMDLGYRNPYGDRLVVRFGFEFPGRKPVGSKQ